MSASQEELRLGEQRETWCNVERMKEESWCRKQRGHNGRYKDEMTSDIHAAKTDLKNHQKSRCDFQPNLPMHREQRHFPRTDNKSQLHI